MSDNSGPAFPSAQIESRFVEEFGRYVDQLGPPHGGMSLRDYFAGRALAGLCATVLFAHGVVAEERVPGELAGYAYAIADAMLKARGAA